MEDGTEEEKQVGLSGEQPADINTETAKAAREEEEEDRHVIELLRTPGLSIKYLDEPTKDRIRRFIQRAHVERGISLVDIAKMIGNKTSGYTSWLTRQLGMQPRAFEEARLKAIKEKRRKYERKPFDGTDEEKAYLLGFRHGDLSAYRQYTTFIIVGLSTTHPGMADLFTSLFSRYGHVSRHPRYKKDTLTYEWNVHVAVDNSFEFLLKPRSEHWNWVGESRGRALAYVGGFIDADGTISIYQQKSSTSLMVTIYNTHIELLEQIAKLSRLMGYTPVGPYLDKRQGTVTSKYKIPRMKDYWKLVIARFDESQRLLQELPLRYDEKIAKKQLALTLSYREPWDNVRPRVEALRTQIRLKRDLFVQAAETTYTATHSSNQTQPSPLFLPLLLATRV